MAALPHISTSRCPPSFDETSREVSDRARVIARLGMRPTTVHRLLGLGEPPRFHFKLLHRASATRSDKGLVMRPQTNDRHRVLLSAYACAPGSGSEPGTSWSWVRELSRHVDLSVVTRANNQQAIEHWLQSHPGELQNVRWLFVDAPSWVLRLKRGTGGIRWYHAVWQLLALRRARSLLRVERHDVAHHVSLMGPGFVMTPFLPIPSVVGPFGGLQPLAPGFVRVAGHPLLEYGRITRNAIRRASPLWRWQLSRTSAIIVANTATRARLPAAARRRSILMQIGTDEAPSDPDDMDKHAQDLAVPRDQPIRVLWGGVHVGWKGLELLIRALPLVRQSAEIPVEVVISGTGVDKQRFERLVARLGPQQSVRFVGWVSRDLYRSLLSSCDIFVFTSLRETTGAALLEAMGMGKPTIVIDHGGPSDIATEATSVKITPDTPSLTIERLGDALTRLISDPDLRHTLGTSAQRRIEQEYSWSVVIHRTLGVYSSILGQGGGVPSDAD